jgi:phage virion morphogenesis protein
MSVSIRGDLKKLLKTLDNASRVNLSRLAKPVGAAMVASTKQRFRDSRDPEGKPWQPLSDVTRALGYGKRDYTPLGRLKQSAARREALRKILVQRATLRNSITYRADGSRVAIGTNLKYARIHQLGGRAGRGKKVRIPARPYLGISKEDRKEIERMTRRFLEEAL